MWIENGELAYPVEGSRWARHLLDMLHAVEEWERPRFRDRTAAADAALGRMTVAGA